MEITIVPGEAEEYTPASDIRTEIESDEAYRARLAAVYPGFTTMKGAELDAFGRTHDMIRIHTHTSAAPAKNPVTYELRLSCSASSRTPNFSPR